MSAPAAHAPLVGRDRELALIDRVLDGARTAEGSSLMFVGEPGSGKTTLLDAARAKAEGFTVVSCTGVEWEAELPFGGLHELLTPLLDHLPALPDPQRLALESALGLVQGSGNQPLHLLAGALSILTEATRSGPVLLIADDLQWIDSTTAEVLSFVARRLTGEAFAFLVGSRPGAELPGLPSPAVDLTPLDQGAVAALASRLLGRPLLDETAADLTQASGGNPLAIVEGLRHLGDDLWLRGTVLDEPLPVGLLIERGFSHRIDGLSEEARVAVELLSASLDPGGALMWRALDRLGPGRDAVTEAERAGIVAFRGADVLFTHPVLRSVVHRLATPERLRACHLALAEAHEQASPDLRAWHEACAAVEPDERVAEALEVAADHFLLRGGSIAASQTLARAADLTPLPDVRADRFIRAGVAAYRAGRSDRAEQLFAAAVASTTDERLRLRAAFHDAVRGAHADEFHDTIRDLEAIVTAARGVDNDVLAVTTSALTSEVMVRGAGDRVEGTVGLLREVAALPDLAPSSAAEVDSLLGQLLALTSTDAAVFTEARELLTRTADARPDLDFIDGASLVEGLTWLEEHDRAARAAAEITRAARERGDAFLLIGGLWCDGYHLFRTGRWTEARRRLEESIRVGRATGSDGQAAVAQATLTSLLAGQGDRSWEQAVPEIEAYARRHGTLMTQELLGAARGLLELGAGRPAQAIEAFSACVAWQAQSGHTEPAAGPWPFDLVEAQVLAGDLDAARAGTEALRIRAAHTGQRWAAAAVARLDGLLATGDAAADHFERSLVLGELAVDPFGQARTRLAYGRFLRRARRRMEAREPLAQALAEFERLGARPWAEQTSRELEATGLTLRRGPTADASALTPQEAQVAELVAAGASNKEVAGTMFLSPKTIETHLSRIYRKIGVSSRTQLAVRLREPAARLDAGDAAGAPARGRQ